MATKAMPEKTNTQQPLTSAPHTNGGQAPNEHLVKANKAMARAWASISRRQNKNG